MKPLFPLLTVSLVLVNACNARVEALSTAPNGPADRDTTDAGIDPTSDAGTAKSPDANSTLPDREIPYAPPTGNSASTKCKWTDDVFQPLGLGCKNRCLVEYAKAKVPRVLADDGDLAFQFSTILGATDSHVLVNASTGSGGANLLMAMPVGGGAPVKLIEDAPGGTMALTLDGNDLLVAVVSFVTINSYSTSIYRIAKNALGPMGANHKLATITTNNSVVRMWSEGTHVFVESGVSTSNGSVHRITANYTVQNVLQRAGLIKSISRDGYLYWLENETGDGTPYATAVFRKSLPNGAPERLIGVSAAADLYVTSGGLLFVSGAKHVYTMAADGTYPRVIFKGTDFPQYQGTLDASFITYDSASGNVYFREICDFDADDPHYGVRKISLTTNTVSWLDQDPAFPWIRENYRQTHSWTPGPIPYNASGLYQLRVQ